MIELIKQRLRALKYDLDDCIIEPFSISLPLESVHIVEPVDNEFLFLYDVSNYSKAFTITDDNTQIKNTDFIIDGKVPCGILEFSGNVRIKTLSIEPITFMFYRAIPGSKKKAKTQ